MANAHKEAFPISKTGKDKEKKSPGKAAGLVIKAADATADVISVSISGVFKVIGTVLLILLVSGMLFACVFAYYVKTCLTPGS